MNELRVGDRRRWNSVGQCFEILFITERSVFYRYLDQGKCEAVRDIKYVLRNSTPYTEPVLVKRVLWFEFENGEIRDAIEGTKDVQEFAHDSEWKRIEITPEMFFGEKK